MSAVLRDIRFALRMLVKSRGYSVVAILTLALAIGANTAIFSAVNALLLRPLPYPDPEQLVMVRENKPEFDELTLSYQNYLDYRAGTSSFSTFAGMGLHTMNLTGDGEPERLFIQMLSHDFLPMLGVEPVLGRNFLPEEDAPGGARVIVLNHGFWTRRFAADPEIIGRKIRLDGGEWTVIGVLPAEFRQFLFPQIVGFIPLASRADEPVFRDRASRIYLHGFARLKPGVTLAQARADLQAIGDELGRRFPEEVGGSRPEVVPLHHAFVKDVRVILLLLFGAVGCVLLIAAANVGNLTLERAIGRQRELGIRAALGAGRWRLIRQMLVESSLLALAGGALGLLFALWGVDVITANLPGLIVGHNMRGPIELDTTVLVFTTVVALGTGLLFGLVPALFASCQDLAQVLKNADHHASAGGSHLRARNLLVIVEVALALMLALAATQSARKLAELNRLDPGFDFSNLLFAVTALSPERYPTSPQLVQFWAEAERRVRAIPGVLSVTTSSGAPGHYASWHNFYPLGAARTPENEHVALVYRSSLGFFETLKIPLLAGRTCGPQDGPGTPPVVLVGRQLADKLFPGQDPVGQRLQDSLSKQPSVEIIGVVGDFKHNGLGMAELTPYQMHYCFPQLPLESQQDPMMGNWMHLLVRTEGDPTALVAQVQAAAREVDPMERSWGVSTIESVMVGSLSPRLFTAKLLGVFAAIALMLAAMGLYAVMANTVAQRTHELGVRVALGAQPHAIVALVVRQGIRLVVVGLALGLLGAFALTSVMSTLLTEAVGAVDLPTYLGVSLLLVIVGLLATYLPARRATRIDPMVALRHE
ncbi:ABC transporter permease [Nannocystis radixulma]|uniref:ABC transporter permease n=1 Tax=Nannocystis radixulma TaxID=2995305 RepID=A0ABT5AZV9_9BACT|nr:ABC transporter permease [Nannocystis radixulma]MDC0667374.1 ABC transporter permease [Nannocystis radixulma]